MVARLQGDEHAPVVERVAGAADGHSDVIDGRILQHDLAERLLMPHHVGEEMSCAASDMPVISPVSCCGKNPLGMIDEEVDRQDERRKEHAAA